LHGRFAPLALALAVALAAAGCASTKRTFYIDETANFAAVEAVAVLPFENFSADTHAPEKLAQILYIELLRSKAFRLADPGDVQRAMGELQIAPTSTLAPEQAAKLGERLAVQALFLGTVQELSVDRSSGVVAPTISLHFEMVDATTGQKIWTSVVSRQGAGTSARLFGVGGTGTNEALHDLVRSALATVIE
jgi:hypothetical protein